MIKYKILKELNKRFGKKNIIIYDESKKHKFLNRQSSHFNITVISDEFTEKSLTIRHKIIYNLLLNIIYKYNIHAISLHTYTKSEFLNVKNNDIISPNCIKKSNIHKDH
ncbi:BolA family protein [Buchnera aphidicola]|uniref:BolA family protein n=1 Tax=Buchnera aphidicola TaxID=9 RepID=UPI0034640327